MDIFKAIEQRGSVRAYQKNPVPQDVLDQLMEYGKRTESLTAGLTTRFILVADGTGIHKRLSGYVGYLGNVMDAPHYIFCLAQHKEGYLENAGFQMEQLILKAGLMGLGTCWISVLKHEDRILAALGMETGERVVALTPVGFPRISGVERFFNTIFFGDAQPKSAKKPGEDLFFLNKWGHRILPENMSRANLYEILEAARQAPSWGNQQPYGLVVTQQGIYLVVEKERDVFKDSPLNHNRLDAGIFMLYLYLAGRAKGIPWRWDTAKSKAPAVTSELGIPPAYEYMGYLAFH